MSDLVRAHIQRSIDTKQKILADESLVAAIQRAGELFTEVLRSGDKLLMCGNGGSASDAQHIATEFLVRYRAKPERPSLPALNLAADSSALTAGGNDFGYDNVFSRQVEGLGREGDGFLGISTSGNSENVIRALAAAKQHKMTTVLFTGGSGGRALAEHAGLVDVAVVVPSAETARIQECHIMIGQILCAIVEHKLYGFE